MLPEATLALMLLLPAGPTMIQPETARAHWLAPGVLAWDVGPVPPGSSFQLHAAADGGLRVASGGVTGGEAFELRHDPAGLPVALRERFPHLGRLPAFRLDPAVVARVPVLLRGQVLVSARRADGELAAVTGVQTAGVLDALLAEDGALGVVLRDGVPTLRLWAPTAREVRLLLFADSRAATPQAVPMTRERGTWSVTGARDWMGRFYQYEVDVFVPATRRFETNRVTDPYSVSLSTNSRRSQIVDLDDPALKPDGWDTLRKPVLEAPEDISVYELHVRDFSASDASVPAGLRGTYRAFTLPDTAGTKHLRALAQAGLTHVHLLPVFDIATVDDDRAAWKEPDLDAAAAPDSEAQQAAVAAVAAHDGFNWGYDPLHSTAPEGSYSTDPDGPARIRELREMVAALNGMGLRVVMDVVYNHTFAAGQDARSVLDRIVPGYYHRRDEAGAVVTSTCCPNTATEHVMMGRLMVDSVVTWARAYKIDGFRFDLMGHHLKRNMLEVRHALDALTAAADGVVGRDVYVYGEGWDFGEVAGNARGTNATQRNMAGTGIGSFSDRLRDAARGGSAFGAPTEQGFLTGLADAPNEHERRTAADRVARSLELADLVRAGIAGNLAAYRFEDHAGRLVRGDEVDYNGSPAGYTLDPQEVVTYVEAHDNETLFDAIQAKAPRTLPMGERVRMQMMGMSLVAFAQGVAFFHAGVDLLRSKSLDRNSYDSGDHFNRLDFTGLTSNWGVGLPPARDNRAHWDVMRPLLADPALRPGPEHVALARAHFQDVLRIRASSRLFRLRTAGEVSAHLRFLGTGPDQVPGVIAFELHDEAGRLDPHHDRVVVVHNARGTHVDLAVPSLRGAALALHPVQEASKDLLVRSAAFSPSTGVFFVPARTSAVFWSVR